MMRLERLTNDDALAMTALPFFGSPYGFQVQRHRAQALVHVEDEPPAVVLVQGGQVHEG